MGYQGLAGALEQANKNGGMGAKRVPLLNIAENQSRAKVIQGARSRMGASSTQGVRNEGQVYKTPNLGPKAQFDDLPKQNPIKSLKKGGVIHKTGLYRLHKGETVVPANKRKWVLSDSGAMKV